MSLPKYIGNQPAAAPNNTHTVGWENPKTITTTYTITSGNNMVSAGPITISTGLVTIPTGSTWTIV